MKKLILIFFGVALSTNVFAATGSGHAQAELSQPLGVTNGRDVDFGVIAIDPATGAQTVYVNRTTGEVSCPATYVCGGTPDRGIIDITGPPNSKINISIAGEEAILSDGIGNTIVFDPTLVFGSDVATEVNIPSGGLAKIGIGGWLSFTGNEPEGSYSSRNAGGSGFVVTVNY